MSVRVASWPSRANNPYVGLLYDALESRDVHLVHGVEADPAELERRAATFDALHIHWPESIWRHRGGFLPWRLRGLWSLFGLRRLLALFAVARRRGFRVVWTVHDLEHHEGAGLADRIGYALLARRCDLFVFHTRWSLERFRAAHPHARGAMLHVPHGSFDGTMRAARPRGETLSALGLEPARRTLLCFGILRAYKGFPRAVQALSLLGARYQLVIAGPPYDGDDQGLARAVAGAANARLIAERLDETRMADLFEAADCVVLPYLRVTSSGVLLAACTAGRGVVATDLPPFREVLADEPEAGVLAPSAEPAALAAAVEEYFTRDPAARGAAARRIADRCAWPRVVEPLAAWLRDHARRCAHP